MLRLGTKSKLKPGEVVKRAVKFFGPGGYGLKVVEENECCVAFEGGGGGVRVSAAAEGKGSNVDLESVEWDYQAKEFIRSIS
ncbi:MAG: hypothetical protein N2506_05045 [Dehalococcoidales bacterium]|nr:hypothetical protein [Dehalococcoidales bacterium]